MKKNLTIGIDTSNYTTSMAVFDTQSLEIVANLKAPLDVKSGERGLRQSDALFAHVKNLPEISERRYLKLPRFQRYTVCKMRYSLKIRP